MRARVTIQTGARLHFGLLAHRPQIGRHFGGAGLMIDSPGVKLTALRGDRDEVIGPKFLASRVQKLMANYRQHLPENRQPPRCQIEIHQFIPPHQGLGSGTQLGLAVGKALSVLAGEDELSPMHLAQRVGRGARSALGLHGFQQGGFLVDGGKSHLEEVGTLVSRNEFPEEWRIILVSPSAEMGLSGTDEQTAFHQLPGMSEALTNRLCRLILMELLPTLVERNFAAFSEAVYEYGEAVGMYFAPIQGGLLASPQMGELAMHLRERGILGVGQSSWGPTLFVFQESPSEADRLLHELREDPAAANCQLRIARPLNQGAAVQMESD